MEDSQVITLLRLCQSISQVHEIPANHDYKCPAARMSHEVYKFHLACSASLDLAALEALCEDFRTCYLCFVMNCKIEVSRSSALLRQKGEGFLERLKNDAIGFVQDIANQEIEKKRLVSIAKFVESIEKFQEISVNSQLFIQSEMIKYQDLIQSALDDLQGEDIEDSDLEFCFKFLSLVKGLQEKFIDEETGAKILTALKEISENLDSLVCCFITGENLSEEASNLKSILTTLHSNLTENLPNTPNLKY